MDLVIRNEGPDDALAVYAVHQAAFGRDAEADLVDAVRAARAAILSLVGVFDDRIVGHVLFTPVSVGNTHAVGLGPLAVDPMSQGQGVGTALVREGLLRLSTLGHGAVVVLGEPGYYQRFGFRPARAYGVSWDRPVPDEVMLVLGLRPVGFMALELRANALADGGVARYLPLFDGV